MVVVVVVQFWVELLKLVRLVFEKVD